VVLADVEQHGHHRQQEGKQFERRGGQAEQGDRIVHRQSGQGQAWRQAGARGQAHQQVEAELAGLAVLDFGDARLGGAEQRGRGALGQARLRQPGLQRQGQGGAHRGFFGDGMAGLVHGAGAYWAGAGQMRGRCGDYARF